MGLFDFLKRKKKEPEPEPLSYEQVVKLMEVVRLQETTAAPKTPPTRPAPATPKPEPVFPSVPAPEPAEKVPVYDEAARKREVAAITDDQALIEIIKYGKDTDPVKQAAIKGLKDQKLLAEVVKWTRRRPNTANSELRALIIRNVRDQEVLIEIANDEYDAEVRRNIVRRIHDTEIVKKCLLSDMNIRTDLGQSLTRKIKDQEDLAEIFQRSKSPGIRNAALKGISDENILRAIILKNPIAYTYLTDHFKKNGMEELAGILEDIKAKEAAMKEAGGYLCSACSGENPPSENGEVSCVCRHCGAENHDWEYVDHVTEYRDYAVGCTYYECKRCKAQKDYRTVDTGYLE